uniref:Uncharacterized protein n=1 Tax=Acrobeloides nanus TaxID=290746 RepID=A0A914ENE8_9BILA
MKPSRWNRFVGSLWWGSGNTTHVANASDQIIWANVVSDYQEAEHQLELLKTVKAFQESLSAQVKYSSKIQPKQGIDQEDQVKGYSKIMPGTHLEFQPGNNTNVYITIYFNELDKEGIKSKEIICQTHKLPSDTSVIVTKDMAIQLAEYGSIWIDTSGKNHRST